MSHAIQSFLLRGYKLTIRWRTHEERFHASVDLGSLATSHNFMALSIEEALQGLENYLTVRTPPLLCRCGHFANAHPPTARGLGTGKCGSCDCDKFEGVPS